jgi:cytochrome c oxidase assembly factor CtaG
MLAHTTVRTWNVEPEPVVGLVLTGLIYARGWRALTRRRPDRFPAWRLWAFMGGLGALFLAVASPADTLADRLLVAHMTQHILLLAVAPPLLLLGMPAVPLLRGLSPRISKAVLGSLMKWPVLRRAGEVLGHPLTCLALSSLAVWTWHVPAAFQLAMRSPAIHATEHACFFATGLLFWWPIVQPWPSRPRWPRGAMIPYLLAADIQNTMLAAILTFADRVLYPLYESAPRVAGLTPLADQVAAGALMWVVMSVAYLIPAGILTVRLLSPSRPVGGVPREQLVK